MDTIIIYDISDNSLRTRVARALMDYGCIRIQESAFYGSMNHNTREKLRLRLGKMMHKNEGNIQFYPLCGKCYALKESIGEIYQIKEEDVTVL
ncbi:MAG: CRISPR-associated endonuclease Cas2 [Methanotrichaceae archaeon]|nr:CRISPR-associated endonuclease Cas2 [Methanotrichaceae archaeon]